MSDLVLAPTACAIGEWAGGPIFVDLEVDARHAFSETLDVSRTVGWFTSRYPVLIDSRTGEAATPAAARLTQGQYSARGIRAGSVFIVQCPDKGQQAGRFCFVGKVDYVNLFWTTLNVI